MADPTDLQTKAWDLVLDAANERYLDTLPERARQLMNDVASLTGKPTPYPGDEP